MRPTLSVIVPTVGNPLLSRLLDSVAGQTLLPEDEVLIVGDTRDGGLPQVAALVTSYGSQFRYLEHDAGCHAWGHPQINHAMRQARGAYLIFNDDDDLFVPGAFEAVREAIGAPRPLLFRFEAHTGEIHWSKAKRVACGQIGGHCIVAPNLPDRLGLWSDRYEGDYDFIVETLAAYKNRARWCAPVLSVARPRLGWRALRTEEDAEAFRRLRNDGREWMTRDTSHITPERQREWFARYPGLTMRAYLFHQQSIVVGAGLLARREDGRLWITVMVAPESRRLGIGRTIFRWLAYAFPGEVLAEIRQDNIASLRAAEHAGYRMVKRKQNLVIMAGRLEGQ